MHGLLIEEAFETATFYATDLRELAIRLSKRNDWKSASGVYRKIVDKLDPDDAYAWEYLAYNLVRLDPVQHADDILSAYAKAHDLDPTNPLYHGRLLGFRGRLGQEIRSEFQNAIALYNWRGVDRFASEVLKSLKRGGSADFAKELVTANRSLLKHPEVRRIMGE